MDSVEPCNVAIDVINVCCIKDITKYGVIAVVSETLINWWCVLQIFRVALIVVYLGTLYVEHF